MKEQKSTIYKTVYQHNQIPISAADMGKLQEIARDCREVRNYVYDKYGGIRGLPKISPGYTAQNEMTKCGLRERLNLPSVYFYLSIFDALGDIKSQWAHVKSEVEKNIRANPNLTPEDRHYLRFVMKQSQCFEAVLVGGETAPKGADLTGTVSGGRIRTGADSGGTVPGGRSPEGAGSGGRVPGRTALTGKWVESYISLCQSVNTHRLNQYLRRQVRRHLVKPHTEAADGFPASPKGYRYADHGIYLAMKERGKRLFIPLTDNNRYTRQVYICLYPEEGRITVNVPIEVRQKHPAGYDGELGLAVGLRCMFVTDQGRTYGERYLEYQSALTDYVREKLPRHRRNMKYNPGTKKYNAGKARLEKAMHDYVNAEINRMLETERPGTVYFPKLPATPRAGYNRRVNATMNMWQRGYVKSRLVQKCRERSVEVAEVFGKGISTQCSGCGAEGVKKHEMFCCKACGLEMPEGENTARNVLERGRLNRSL